MAAAITSANRLWDQATGGRRSALYQLSGVDSGDTIDLSTVGGLAFKKLICAVFFGQAQGTGVAGSVSGTTVTMTSTGMADDSVLLLVEGVT